MKVAYIFIPHFPLAVELREDASLDGLPVVIGGLPHEKGTVYDASPEALEQGVAAGMSLRQAEELCPEAVFLPLREERYTPAFEELLLALGSFSPLIEPHGLGGAYLEVSGLQRLYGPDERLGQSIARAVEVATRLPAKIGIASGKFTARMAALEAPSDDIQVVAPGKERRSLQGLPVSLLPIGEEMRERLHLLGIRTMGQLASLPASAALTQFGLEGRRAHQLARGRDSSKVVDGRRQGPQELEYRFEDPVEGTQILHLAATQLCTKLLRQLHSRGQVCGKVVVALEYDTGEEKEGHVDLSEPSSDEHKIGLAVERLVSGFRCEDRISGLRLSLGQLSQGQGHQLSLFPTRTLRQRRIDRALANITGKYGGRCLLQAQLLDPQAALPDRRFALLDHQDPLEHVPVKRDYEQAVSTSTRYQVHEWR
jgi:DNA polymerase-4